MKHYITSYSQQFSWYEFQAFYICIGGLVYNLKEGTSRIHIFEGLIKNLGAKNNSGRFFINPSKIVYNIHSLISSYPIIEKII